MNELFSVDGTIKVHVSRLDGAFGLTVGNSYVILPESEAALLAEHLLSPAAVPEPTPEPEVGSDEDVEETPAEEPVLGYPEGWEEEPTEVDNG